jgi:hypothetical protein
MNGGVFYSYERRIPRRNSLSLVSHLLDLYNHDQSKMYHAIRNDFLQQQLEKRNSSSTVRAFSESDDASTSVHSQNSTDELGFYDVICGRHKAAFNNIGNRRFRISVALAQERYTSASTRIDKSIVIKSIADLVRSTGGRFLHRKDGAWVELEEKHVHEKVGHALRDMAVASAMKSQCSFNRFPKSSSKTTKTAFCPAKKSTDRSVHSDSMADVGKAATNGTMHFEARACAEIPTNQFNSHEDHETMVTSEDTAMEPIAWSHPMQLGRDSPTMENNILSWLSDESSWILQDFDP